MKSPPESDSTPTEPSADSIRANGWRQGAVLSPDLLAVGRECWDLDTHEECLGVVLTQDCDLVHYSFQNEPYVEVVLASELDKADGNLRWAKNPRTIILEVGGGFIKLDIHARHRLNRELFCEHKPHESLRLDEESVRQLRSWVARRYKRAAFPDSFNERLKPLESKISKKLKDAGEITGIYLLVSDEELGAGEHYDVEMRATMLPGHYEDWDKLDRCQKALDAVATLVERADGVRLSDHHLVSEQDVSLDDLRYLKRWDYDSLTLRSNSIDPPDED